MASTAQTDRYTIGWIAPLALELIAARAILDEDHQDIHVNEYNYHGGRIGQHYVVMAVQPKMGTDAASALAARMHAAFKNIRYFLVVGIGGGVPCYGSPGALSQIVLGDVVVSSPRGLYGGVIRYDLGAWTGQDRLEIRGHTNGPPPALLSAINSLVARHSSGSGTEMPKILQEMRRKIHSSEQVQFEDQGAEEDRLFDHLYPHPQEFWDIDCKDICDQGQSQRRQDRGKNAIRQMDTPHIHHGTIGSSNQLQISAASRNKLQKEHGIICFEMEGAGVIHEHPSLVIRGICDYSDSHKNKKWQKYAAATAAAYAKELLFIIPAQNSYSNQRDTIEIQTAQQKNHDDFNVHQTVSQHR